MSPTDNNFKTMKSINDNGSIDTKVKRIYSANKNGLFDRFTLLSMTPNDYAYALDEFNYYSHFLACLQKDTIKPNDHVEEC